MKTLHVVFTSGGAVDLRTALFRAGRDEDVVSLLDNYSFGPIDPPDAAARARWAAAELGWDNFVETAESATVFWTAAMAPARRRVIWISRRTAQEYAGFLAFVARSEGEFDVVDVTDVRVRWRRKGNTDTQTMLAGSLGLISAANIVDNGLLDKAVPINASMRDAYCAAWDKLRMENASFRVVSASLILESAPINVFDSLLQKHVTHDWRKAALVIGHAIMEDCDFEGELRLQVGDLVLASRLRAMVAAGVLEGRGDLSQIQLSEVRLPAVV
jgi:hypothetical protein